MAIECSVKNLDAENLQILLQLYPECIRAENATWEAIEACHRLGVELVLSPSAEALLDLGVVDKSYSGEGLASVPLGKAEKIIGMLLLDAGTRISHVVVDKGHSGEELAPCKRLAHGTGDVCCGKCHTVADKNRTEMKADLSGLQSAATEEAENVLANTKFRVSISRGETHADQSRRFADAHNVVLGRTRGGMGTPTKGACHHHDLERVKEVIDALPEAFLRRCRAAGLHLSMTAEMAKELRCLAAQGDRKAMTILCHVRVEPQ